MRISAVFCDVKVHTSVKPGFGLCSSSIVLVSLPLAHTQHADATTTTTTEDNHVFRAAAATTFAGGGGATTASSGRSLGENNTLKKEEDTLFATKQRGFFIWEICFASLDSAVHTQRERGGLERTSAAKAGDVLLC